MTGCRWNGAEIGGYATAAALIASIVTFLYTYHSQEKFNKSSLELQATVLRLQQEANKEQHAANDVQLQAALAQRETAAVEALARFLDKPTEPMAWESGEAIIDIFKNDVDSAWRATVRRALYNHPNNLRTFECDLYSQPFKDFVVSLTVSRKEDDLCHGKAKFVPRGSQTDGDGQSAPTKTP